MQEIDNSQMPEGQQGKRSDEQGNTNGRQSELKSYQEVHSELVVQTLAQAYAFILSWPFLEDEENSDSDGEEELIESIDDEDKEVTDDAEGGTEQFE